MRGIGRFRDLVRVDRDSRTQDNPQPDYSGTPRYRQVPCDITVVAGTETFRGRQLKAETTHVVDLQRIDDIDPTDRLVVIGGHQSGKTLHIVAVLPRDYDGRAPKLEIECKVLA